MAVKFSKLIGLKKEDFDILVKQPDSPIHVRPARLIPVVKTGDEMALTSIFLSSLKLVKEFRDCIFKDIKLSRSGRFYFYTEVCFPKIDDKSRIDGLILVTKGKVIQDAVLVEVKSGNNELDTTQMKKYVQIAKGLKVNKVVTISNQFVSSPDQTPLKLATGKLSLFHLSWSYITTLGHILLYNNDNEIQDFDQTEIMKEALHYMEHPKTGISGFNYMKGWKKITENVSAKAPLKKTSLEVLDAVTSWQQEKSDIALILSRNLGVLAKTSIINKKTTESDVSRLIKDYTLTGKVSIRNSISDIKIIVDFERKSVTLKNTLQPNMDKGNVAKITWLKKQILSCQQKENEIYERIRDKIWIEANIKFARTNLKVNFKDIEELYEQSKGKEIQEFVVSVISVFGKSFQSEKKFIELFEKLVLDYYEGIVQNLSNWNSPAPKLHLSD